MRKIKLRQIQSSRGSLLTQEEPFPVELPGHQMEIVDISPYAEKWLFDTADDLFEDSIEHSLAQNYAGLLPVIEVDSPNRRPRWTFQKMDMGGAPRRVYRILDEKWNFALSPGLQTQLDLVANLFQVSDYGEIVTYVTPRPHLVPLLFETYQVLSTITPEPTLSLEVIRDQESDAEQMYAVAKVPADPEKVYDIQDQVDDVWWFERGPRALGDMNIVIEPAVEI